MVRFLVVGDWDQDNHPNRINDTETELQAQALVDKLKNNMPVGKEAPNAFYAPDPLVAAG